MFLVVEVSEIVASSSLASPELFRLRQANPPQSPPTTRRNTEYGMRRPVLVLSASNRKREAQPIASAIAR